MRFKPKKRLGQNFLIDKNILHKIISASDFKPSDLVLEIGAGRGELTKVVAPMVNKVIAIEIDTSLRPALEQGLAGYRNAIIINQDFLEFDLGSYFKNTKGKLKAIGNIPYYITTPIIEHLFKYRDKIEVIFLTVQKEFAERMQAPAGSKDYGSFSCFIQYYCQAKILFHITKTCFRPVPKVDSSFLRLVIRNAPPVEVRDEELLFKIIRAAFNKRRKTLRNSLKDIITAATLDTFFKKYQINPNIRPESLTLDDFAHLANL